MTTENVVRLLAQQGDPHATMALKKYAVRHNDQLLNDYAEEVAKANLERLQHERNLWQSCLGLGRSLILLSFGEKKIQAVKVVRSLTGLGVKEAKVIVDNTPVVVVEKIRDPRKAEAAVREFTDIGNGVKAVWGEPKQIEAERNIHLNRKFALKSLEPKVLLHGPLE